MADIRSGHPPQAPAERRVEVAAAPVTPAARPVSAARPAPVARQRPDARPLRIAFGMGALAAASALVTALASPPMASVAPVLADTTITLPPAPTPVVRHVIQYVQLKPGQTAPPRAVVKQAPAPKPRVVVVTTRQSGKVP